MNKEDTIKFVKLHVLRHVMKTLRLREEKEREG